MLGPLELLLYAIAFWRFFLSVLLTAIGMAVTHSYLPGAWYWAIVLPLGFLGLSLGVYFEWRSRV